MIRGENDFKDLLSRFPKQRPDLPEEYKKIYKELYKKNRHGCGLADKTSQWFERWMHKQVAAYPKLFPVLEIGAGTLNHIPWEPFDGDYDIVEPFDDLYLSSPNFMRVRRIYKNIKEIPSSERYSRIISVAVLEHVTDLPDLIAKSALLLEKGCEFRAGIPSEGSVLWYLAWKFGTGLAFRRYTGLTYDKLMRYEHINKEWEIITLIKYIFNNTKIRRFPAPWFQLSLYTSVKAKAPNLEVVQYILSR